MEMITADDVLKFWFETPGLSATQAERGKLWFGGGPKVDQMIRELFEEHVRRAVIGEYDSWAVNARGTLALIILLDQFSLNLFRDQPRSHLQSMMAVPYALKGIAQGFDQQVDPMWRTFYYLPLEHSEDIHLQRMAVALFEKTPELADFGRYAVKHLQVIEKFGRFPYWNDVLGRPSTPAEQKWLDDGGPDY